MSSQTSPVETHPISADCRVLLNAAPDATLVVNSDGYVVIANPIAQKLFGYAEDELIGRAVESLMPQRYRSGHQSFRAQFQAEPQARSMGAGLELFAERKDGSEVPVDVSLSPLETDHGRYILVAIRDVTERRRAAEALRKSEAEYRTLFEYANDAIMIFELEDETILEVNPRACEVYGFTREEMIGRSLKTLTRDVTRGEDGLQEFVKTGHCRGFQTVHFRKDGTEMNIVANSALIERDGRKVVLSIDRDDTARIAAEAERERLIAELTDALARIKTLTGLLPICSSCKKIRDEHGRWTPIEVYVRDRSEADFTHGICPDCGTRLYPDHYKRQ